MEVNESGQWPSGSAAGSIDPYRQVGCRSGDEAVFNACNLLGRALEFLLWQRRKAPLGRRHRLEGFGAGVHHLLDKLFCLWVEWHWIFTSFNP
jgi:hypothetical protein